jgi:hypothetical protein
MFLLFLSTMMQLELLAGYSWHPTEQIGHRIALIHYAAWLFQFWGQVFLLWISLLQVSFPSNDASRLKCPCDHHFPCDQFDGGIHGSSTAFDNKYSIVLHWLLLHCLVLEAAEWVNSIEPAAIIELSQYIVTALHDYCRFWFCFLCFQQPALTFLLLVELELELCLCHSLLVFWHCWWLHITDLFILLLPQIAALPVDSDQSQ